MESEIALQRAGSAASSGIRQPASPSGDIGCRPIPQLSPGEALILVLVLSLGLWALFWAAVSLLR